MAKQAGDLLTGSLDQRLIYEACRRGVLDRQLPVLRAHYAHKRDVVEHALRRELGTAVSWPKPKGGFFLWLTLAGGLDADKMIPRAVEHGVIYVAGEAFYVNALRPFDQLTLALSSVEGRVPQGAPSEHGESKGGEGHNTLRLSFSAPTPERIDAGVSRLALTLRGESAARATGAATAAPGAS